MTYNARSEMVNLVYPEQQHFDIDTLSPINDATRKRIDYLRANVPELWEHGDSFLDIGCAKGLISHLVADSYDAISGYEPDPELYRLALAIAAHRGNASVHICRGDHRSIPLMLGSNNEKGEKTRPQVQYTTVWAGDVHHYFVAIGQAAGAPWLWVQKLKSLSTKYIILDGPVHSTDFAVKKLADVYKWPETLSALYNPFTLETHFRPQFELVRAINNERGRQTMIFKRVKEDIEAMHITTLDIERFKANGKDIKTDYRLPWSVIKIYDQRYKFDVGCLPPGVLQLLGHLPWFPETITVLRDPANNLIGDVCRWINGECPKQYIDLLPDWLRMNVALSSVGLFEPAYRLGNFIRTNNSNYIDLDYDMVHNLSHYAADETYKEAWKRMVGMLLAESLYARQEVMPDRF